MGKKGGKQPGAGRPKGSTTRPQMRDFLTEKQVHELIDKAFELAKAGDTKMVAFVLEQVLGKAPQAIEANVSGQIIVTFDESLHETP